MLFLSMLALVLTTGPVSVYAQEEKDATSSCELSYVDVVCAKKPEECAKNKALQSTSINADFYFAQPHHASFQASAIVSNSQSDSVNYSLSGPNLDAEKLFQLVNSYRNSIGLPSFQKDSKLCAVAASREPELQNEISTGDIHGGMRRRNLPYWVTENMKWGVSEEEVLSWWLNSSIHASAIHGTNQFACTQCSGPVCIMLFTDFVSKGGSLVSPTAEPETAMQE